jgi:outer membrane protein OmpA-like peptidoglycan-associated protein
MKPLIFFALLLTLEPINIYAQKSTPDNYTLEGAITNEKNGNSLPDVQIIVYDDKTYAPIGTAITDGSGNYKLTVPMKERYRIESKKSTYFKANKVINTSENMPSRQDIAMNNKPGYVFDVTIFDKAHQHLAINSLADCKIEIYNNTTKEQELTIPQHPKSVFNFPFNEGNHYTILVRKPGYINRRIEAYVNINGCILCIDGMGVKEPDVVALMTHENETGYFLGNIDLDSIKIGKKFVIPNIYYDFDKWNIRPDAAKILDKLAGFLKDNPAVKVELGSHTDVRGSDNYNMTLSDKRAEAAVQYIVDKHGISRENLTWKGYGESELVNGCANGANCTEGEHQMNRRTELKIIGYSETDPLWKYSLKEIIEDKNLYLKVIKLEKPGQPKTGSVSLN